MGVRKGEGVEREQGGSGGRKGKEGEDTEREDGGKEREERKGELVLPGLGLPIPSLAIDTQGMDTFPKNISCANGTCGSRPPF